MTSKIQTLVDTKFTVSGDRVAVKKTSAVTRAFAKNELQAKRTRLGVLRLGKSFTSFRNIALPFVAGAIAAGLGIFLLAKRSIEAADAIGKTADALGVGIEFLQEFRFAGEQSGVSIEAADKALGRLTKSLGEAKVGTGSLTTFLKLYDTELLTSLQATKDTEEGLAVLFQRLASMTDVTKRAALSNAAFGRSGAAINVMLKNGVKSFAEARRQARELGLVLGETLVRAAEKANDALNIMRRIFTVNLTRAMLTLAPLITELGNRFAEFAPQIANAIKSLLPDSLSSVEELQKRLTGIIVDIELTQDKINLLGRTQGISDFLLLGSGDKGLTVAQVTLANLEKQKVALQALIATRQRADQAAKVETDRLLKGQDLTTFEKKVDQLVQRSERLGKTQQELAVETQRALLLEAEALGVSGQALDDYALKIGMATRRQLDFLDAQNKTVTPLQRFSTEVQDVATQTQNSLVGAFRASEEALLDFIDGTKSAGEALQDFLTGILRDVNRAIIRQAILSPLLGSLGLGKETEGGLISGKKFAGGGQVRDRVPALLEPGEFVLRKEAVRNIGVSGAQALNRGFDKSPFRNLQIVVNNQGTAQESAGQPRVDIDPEKLVVNLFVRDMENNGPMRQSLRGLR